MYFGVENMRDVIRTSIKIPTDTLIKIKQNCRNYAKRQYTWLKHKMEVKWFNTNFNNFDETINEIIY